MRFYTASVICFFILISGSLNAASKFNIQSTVNYLTSPSLEGRFTGSKGERKATQYIANYFHSLGLQPAGTDGSYFQSFLFTKGVIIGNNNSLLVKDVNGNSHSLILNKDWRPLSFSDAGSFKINYFVFAGYGIVAPAFGKIPGTNDYQHLNVKNKWVIVFRGMPEYLSNRPYKQLNPFSSLRYKTFLAKENGAQGIIFINRRLNTQIKQQLIPFESSSSINGCGIKAISISDKALEAILSSQSANISLRKYKRLLDREKNPDPPKIGKVQLSGHIDLRKDIQQGYNVIAKLVTAPKANGMIIIGAHIDHLGHTNHQIYPGADDNASGVAGMMETAQLLINLHQQGKLPTTENIYSLHGPVKNWGL